MGKLFRVKYDKNPFSITKFAKAENRTQGLVLQKFLANKYVAKLSLHFGKENTSDLV